VWIGDSLTAASEVIECATKTADGCEALLSK
jgi:hypothetical protein